MKNRLNFQGRFSTVEGVMSFVTKNPFVFVKAIMTEPQYDLRFITIKRQIST